MYSAATSDDRGFSLPPWSQIRVEASNVFAKASMEISLQPAPDARLMEGTKGRPILADGNSLMLASAEVRAKLPLKRKHWTGRVWFDGTSGAALQRIRFKHGGDASRKSYRFGHKGVERIVARPRGADEADLHTDAWNNKQRLYFPYPSKRTGCDVISDPMLLLILAADMRSVGDTNKTACLFNKKTLYRVRLEVESTEELQVRYVVTTKNKQKTIEDRVTATKVLVSAMLLDPKAQNREAFDFMGLEGEIAFWNDTATGLPLAVGGELSGVGEVRFRLSAASLH